MEVNGGGGRGGSCVGGRGMDEETAEVAALREKYARVDPGVLAEEQARAAAAEAGGGGGAAASEGDRHRVVLCPLCQGSGVVKEVENFRELEHNCEHCDGEGTYITVKGERQAPAGVSGHKHEVEGDHSVGPKVVALRHRLQLLEAQRQSYNAEVSNLRERSGSSGEEERVLVESLLTQLRLMADKVEAEKERIATQMRHLLDEEDSSMSPCSSDSAPDLEN